MVLFCVCLNGLLVVMCVSVLCVFGGRLFVLFVVCDGVVVGVDVVVWLVLVMLLVGVMWCCC